MDHHYIVYRITNLINNKYYIGSHKTTNLDDGYMGSGNLIKRSISKYGIGNFKKEILFDFDNPIKMFDKERELVKTNIDDPNSYNIKFGGCGGYDFINENGKNLYGYNGHTWRENLMCGSELMGRLKEKGTYDAYKNKMSKLTKERIQLNGNPFSGKTHTEEFKKRMSDLRRGSIRLSIHGDKNPMYGKCWINNGISSKICDKTNIPIGWTMGRVKKQKTEKVRNIKINMKSPKISPMGSTDSIIESTFNVLDKKKIKIDTNQKAKFTEIYNQFLNGECKSIREFCNSGLYDKSHVNLTKQFKRYIPELYNPIQRKSYK